MTSLVVQSRPSSSLIVQSTPYLIIEYSEDGLVWSQTYHASDIYCRFSVDNGFSFGAALRIRGDKGDAGRTILSGTVDPTSEGVDGDYYINISTSTMFGPKNVTWPTGVSLVGPAGADGVGIPSISEGDASKVLAVKSDESGAEWVDAPSGVSLGMVIALGGD